MIVLDTHVLIWWVSDTGRISSRARRAIRRALDTGPVAVSTISILEIATAVRRGRLSLTTSVDQWLDDLRLHPDIGFQPVSFEIARTAGALSDIVPGDPADRIILATATVLGAQLVTADERLRKTSAAQAIW